MNNINNFNEFALTNEQAEQTNGGCSGRRRRRRRSRCGTRTRYSSCRTYTQPTYNICAPAPQPPVVEPPVVIEPPVVEPPVIEPPTSSIPEAVQPIDGCTDPECIENGDF